MGNLRRYQERRIRIGQLYSKACGFDSEDFLQVYVPVPVWSEVLVYLIYMVYGKAFILKEILGRILF